MANKIVEQSRAKAMQERYIESNRICELNRTDDKYRQCQCCGISAEILENDWDNEDGEIFEIKIGHHNRSTTICMCTECLSKLGDSIWEVTG